MKLLVKKKKPTNYTHLLQVVNQHCVVHIKKETNEWCPQSPVTSLNSLILTVEFPLGSGCIAAEATAILNSCFNYNYSSMFSSVVQTFSPHETHVTEAEVWASRMPCGMAACYLYFCSSPKGRVLCSTPSEQPHALCCFLGISRSDGCLPTSRAARHIPQNFTFLSNLTHNFRLKSSNLLLKTKNTNR